MALEGITKALQAEIEAEIEKRVAERLKTVDARFEKLEKKEASLAKEKEALDQRAKNLDEQLAKLRKQEDEIYSKKQEQEKRAREVEDMAKLGEAVKGYHQAMDKLDDQLIDQNPHSARAMRRFMKGFGFGYPFGGF